MPTPINWDNLPDSALIRQRELMPLLPFSHATMWRRVKDGSFPRPVKIGRTISAWQWGGVRHWLASHQASSHARKIGGAR